jgi:hypothetical protein
LHLSTGREKLKEQWMALLFDGDDEVVQLLEIIISENAGGNKADE